MHKDAAQSILVIHEATCNMTDAEDCRSIVIIIVFLVSFTFLDRYSTPILIPVQTSATELHKSVNVLHRFSSREMLEGLRTPSATSIQRAVRANTARWHAKEIWIVCSAYWERKKKEQCNSEKKIRGKMISKKEESWRGWWRRKHFYKEGEREGDVIERFVQDRAREMRNEMEFPVLVYFTVTASFCIYLISSGLSE